MQPKRLVSALYDDFRPFNLWTDIFNSFTATANPNKLQDNDVLVLWGGGDISPSFYGHKKHRFGGGSEVPVKRDVWEWNLLQTCKERNIPVIGICRGAQMMCASEGGYLVQHVDGHAGQAHPISWADGDITTVCSLHHQMMVPAGNFELIAKSTTPLGAEYYAMDNDGKEIKFDSLVEPEFIYYPDIKGFAIQWHPEFMSPATEATQKLLKFIKEKLND